MHRLEKFLRGKRKLVANDLIEMAGDKMIFQSSQPDKISFLYPNVNEKETPLPRSWSPKDKFNLIGLSQNNLRVNYKG